MNTRAEISDRLRLRLERARTHYERAGEEYRRLMRFSKETLHPEDPGLNDGNYAARQAMLIQSEALLRYQHALKDFTDFTIYGKLPPDEEK